MDYNTGPTALIFSGQTLGPVIRIGEHNVSGGANDGERFRSILRLFYVDFALLKRRPLGAGGGLGCGGNVFFQNIGVSGYECGIHIVVGAQPILPLLVIYKSTLR